MRTPVAKQCRTMERCESALHPCMPLRQASAQQTAALARQAAAEQRRCGIEGQVHAQEQAVQRLELAVQEVADRVAVERQQADARHTAHAEAQVTLFLFLGPALRGEPWEVRPTISACVQACSAAGSGHTTSGAGKTL